MTVFFTSDDKQKFESLFGPVPEKIHSHNKCHVYKENGHWRVGLANVRNSESIVSLSAARFLAAYLNAMEGLPS